MFILNILIVDDSMITIKKLTAILEKMGHRVVGHCRSGAEAVDSYAKIMPDLVTMDITMPDMNGIQATERIMKKYPDAVIVMVTSHGQEQMVHQAMRSGAKGYILKPLRPEIIADTLKKITQRYLA